MFNCILVWLADHSLFISSGALFVAILLRFEKILRPNLKRWLIILDVGFAIVVFLMGYLKDNLDEKWKQEVKVQVENSQMKQDSTTAELLQTQKELNITNARLARLGPRHLSREQFNHIQRELKTNRISKTIMVRVDGSDGEATNFASELLETLVISGCEAKGEASTFGFVIPPGFVNIVSNTGELDSQALVIKKCFETANIPSAVFILPAWPGTNSTITLFIGKRIPDEI